MKLADSGVIYDRVGHFYYYNGKQLQGVTKMINTRLFPDKYKTPDNMDSEQWESTLAKAAEKGNAIHDACENYDYGHGILGYHDEVAAYADACIKKDLAHIASEYIVTDKTCFASPIDKVFYVDEHTVDLGDIKTTSTLDKEYVSWQLSIYAELFERQNPDIKVRHLYGIHIRNKKCRIVRVKRKSANDVDDLMMDEMFGMPIVKAEPTLPSMPSHYLEVQQEIAELIRTRTELKSKEDELKARILTEMDDAEVTKWDGDIISFTRTADSSREVFDTKRFKEEHPELYKQYTYITNTRGSVKIIVK